MKVNKKNENVINSIMKVSGYNVIENLDKTKGLKVKLNNAVSNEIQLKITKNDKNQDRMLRYILQIIVGVNAGIVQHEQIDKGEYRVEYRYSTYNRKTKTKQEYMVKNKITENEITRTIEKIEQQEENPATLQGFGLFAKMYEIGKWHQNNLKGFPRVLNGKGVLGYRKGVKVDQKQNQQVLGVFGVVGNDLLE